MGRLEDLFNRCITVREMGRCVSSILECDADQSDLLARTVYETVVSCLHTDWVDIYDVLYSVLDLLFLKASKEGL
jgi:hypothetical protein